MTSRACLDCGRPLSPTAPEWHTRCFGCWSRHSVAAARNESATVAALRAEVDTLRAELAGMAAVCDELAAQPRLDRDRVRKLLQLCHPDRHDGSALAQECTRWLLLAREQIATEAQR